MIQEAQMKLKQRNFCNGKLVGIKYVWRLVSKNVKKYIYMLVWKPKTYQYSSHVTILLCVGIWRMFLMELLIEYGFSTNNPSF